MDEENQNLNDTTERKQTSGAEKVEKAGNATAKGIKAGKTIAKIIKSLKGLGALGPIAIIILIIIIVIIILVGVVGFFLEMPGLMNNKIAEFAGNLADSIESFYSGNKAYFNSDEQVELAKYLENMGYPPYEFGFGRYMDEDGNYIEANENTDEVTMNSRYLNAYLTADYNTYVKDEPIKGAISDLLHGIRNGVGYILGIPPDEDEAVFGMLQIDESHMNWFESIDTDAKSKTMTIKTKEGLFTNRYYTYNMEGWTARYGKPLELSITLHLATMAPDLVYRLDMDKQEDTKIVIGSTEQYTANIKFEYRINAANDDGTQITTDFASVDSNLSDLDEHISESRKLESEDLKKLKEAIEKNKQSESLDKLDACYTNYEQFLKVTTSDSQVKDFVKNDDITIKNYLDSNEWYKNFLGVWADISLENLFKSLDTCIKEAKEYDSDAEFYTDDYFGLLGEERAGIYKGDRGIMKEYYELRDSLEEDGELSDSDCDELLTFMQDKLGDLKDEIDKDIELLRDIAGEQDENSQKLQEELRKIGLSEDAIDKAIQYNDGEGENQGTDIQTVKPYILRVVDHWYKDVIFVGNGHNAYKPNGKTSTSESTYESMFNPASASDDSILAPNDKGAFYVIETSSGSDIVTQTQDAIRGATNPHTKELFVGTADRPAKYFVYDGSKKTAEKIDELRIIYNAAYNSEYSSSRDDRKARNAAEDAVEAEEEKNGTNFYKEVDVRKNALSAFSILENSKSEDAEYILRDLKALFVDLGYFTKDDFKADETHVMQWPISGYVDAYWPQRRYEKQQKDHGTLIRSKVSTDNIKEGLNADGTERSADDESVQIYPPNLNPDSTSSASSAGVPDLDDEDTDTEDDADDEDASPPTDTVRDGFEADLNVVSPVTGEVLEEGTDADGLGYIKIKVLDTSSIPEYAEFYEEYRDVCTGYIMYIKGFKSVPVNADSESEYLKVKHTGKYFIENGYADDYIDLEKNGVLEEFEEAEEKRVEAPAYLEVNGKKYIKEGTVIGTTTNADLTLYLLNRENSVIEDVETYIRLVDNKGIDTEFPEEFIFWLGVELEGACEGPYDLGDAYGVEVLADGAGNTTAFGLTKAVAGTGEVPNMYPQFAEHLASGRVPKKEAQDVFVLVLEAAREDVLSRVDDEGSLSESMLDALVDLHHAGPALCYKAIDRLNSNGTLTLSDFEEIWGTNTTYEKQLRGRAHVRGVLAMDEEYRHPYDSSYPLYTFHTDTPWTDFINGTPSSEIATLG